MKRSLDVCMCVTVFSIEFKGLFVHIRKVTVLRWVCLSVCEYKTVCVGRSSVLCGGGL